MIDLLEGRALPGAKPPEAGRTLAGTLSAVVLAGALAFGGFVAHTAPSGLLGGATLGWPASPSRVADRPPEAPPAATGPTERAGGGRGKPVAVTSARATETVGPASGHPDPVHHRRRRPRRVPGDRFLRHADRGPVDADAPARLVVRGSHARRAQLDPVPSRQPGDGPPDDG